MKLNLKNATLAALLAVVPAMPVAFATGKPSGNLTPAERAAYQKKLFDLADEKKDGKVTEKEFVIFLMYTMFTDYSKGDKTLTREQFMKADPGTEAKNAAEWKMMDAKGKGFVTFREALRNKPAIEEMQAEFRKLDKSSKGYITVKDLPSVGN